MKPIFRRIFVSASVLLLAASAGLMVSCSGSSSESIIRNVTLLVNGFYRSCENPGSDLVVGNHSGNAVTSLNLSQNGAVIEGVDSNGKVFRGTIGNVTDNTTASFTMEGVASDGTPVTITGSFTVPEGSTEGRMQGTWIEPSLFAPFCGDAEVPQNNVSTNENGNGGGGTNGMGTALSLSIDGGESATIDITSSDLTRELTASGGTIPYGFSVDDAGTLGSLTQVDSETVRWTANGVGTGTARITVTDNASDSASVDLTHQAGP